MRTRRLWLCVAPAFLSTLDNGMTLWGQPEAYWAGDYARYDEFNPVSAWSLAWHPVVLLAQNVLWIFAFGLLVVALPARPAKILALAVALGHATGTSGWVQARWQCFALYPILFLATAALVVLTWEKAEDGEAVRHLEGEGLDQKTPARLRVEE